MTSVAVRDRRWLWVASAQGLAFVGTFGVLKTAAVVLEVEQFGHLAIGLAAAGAVNMLATGPLTSWAVRHYQEADEARALRTYLRAVERAFTIGAGVVAGGVAFVAIAVPEIVAVLHLPAATPMLGVGLGVASGTCDLFTGIVSAALRSRTTAAYLVLSPAVKIAAVVLVAMAGYGSATSILAAMAAATLLLAAVQAFHVHRMLSVGISRASSPALTGKAIIRYAAPFALWALPAYVIAFGDRLTLAHYESPRTVGVYAAMAAATLGVVNALTSVTNRVVEPRVYAIAGDASDCARCARAHGAIGLATGAMAMVAVPVVMMYALWPAEVIRVFASSAYTSDADLLWVLGSSGALFALSQQLILHGLVEKRPWVYLPAKFAHATFLVILLVILGPRFGLAGVVYALLFAHLFQVVLLIVTNAVVGIMPRRRQASSLLAFAPTNRII